MWFTSKNFGFTFASIFYYLLLAGLNRDLNNIVDSSETFESVLPHQNIQEAATQAAQTAAAAEQQAVQQQVQVNLFKNPIISKKIELSRQIKGVHFSTFGQKMCYERTRSFRVFLQIFILQWKTNTAIHYITMNWRKFWIAWNIATAS